MKLEKTLYAAVATVIALGATPAGAQRNDARAENQSDLTFTERRDELILDADEALEQLRRQDELAAALLEEAYGHAVFNTTKGGLILTGAGGTGVARSSDRSDITFMRLGAAGIGLGAGFENYKLVMLFEDAETYSSFVAGQWDGALAAQAAAGTEGVSSEEQFVGGVRVFRITNGGLMAQVDATALRFWPYNRLNRAVDIEERIVAAASGNVPDAIAQRDAIEERAIDQESAPGAADSPSAETFADIERRVDAEAATDIAPSSPERLDQLATEREDLDIFVAAVKAAGLTNALTGTTRYTLFAPTNEAFESMSGMTREQLLAAENREELVRLLRAHIVADDLDREMAGNIPEALTLDGGTVRVDVEGDRFTVGNAAVVQSDIESGNLRVHVVDQVLSAPVQVAEADIDAAALDIDDADDAAALDIDAVEENVEAAQADIEAAASDIDEAGESASSAEALGDDASGATEPSGSDAGEDVEERIETERL